MEASYHTRSFAYIYKLADFSVQFSCSVVSNSATPWTAACQASLSITNSQSLLKFMSIEVVMPLTNKQKQNPLAVLVEIPLNL